MKASSTIRPMQAASTGVLASRAPTRIMQSRPAALRTHNSGRQCFAVVAYATDERRNGSTLEKSANKDLPLVKMFIAGPDGGEPLLYSVPAARSATPIAPAADPWAASGNDNDSNWSVPRPSEPANNSNGSSSSALTSRSDDPLAPPPEVLAAVSASSDRALRGELSSVSAELRSTSAELAESRQAFRVKDKQIAHLKAELAAKDLRLSAARAELLESHMQLQAREIELHDAYAKLTTASTERGKLRAQLINTELELEETRLELQEWADNLEQLKGAMVDLDAGGQPPEEFQALIEKFSESAVDPQGIYDVVNAAEEELEVEENGAQSSVNGASSGAQGGSFFGSAMRFVQDLHDLSSKLVKDAKEDDHIFGKAADIKPMPKRKA